MADERLHPHFTGHRFAPSGLAPMPEKTRGKHRWIVIATYHVSRESLLEADRGGLAILDQENLVYLARGCVDCEEPWPAPEPCPAGDEWTPDGR